MTLIEEWILQIVEKGENEAFTNIIETFQKPIFMYCYRLLGNRQEAEDATQDIFFKAYQKLEQYKPVCSFSSWIYKIAYNHCLDLSRKRKTYQRIKRLFTFNPVTESIEQTFEKQLFSESLTYALSKLSLQERNLLILRIFEEKTFDEIGLIFGKSTVAVKKQYERTKNKVKKQINESEAKEHEECATLS
ncbi:RNA polymerase sigma factor [Aneurinibacillus aneurinilyticus]|uniref:RNA polymerase sigma factor n=1 Tax=Aneurinibacillus aneurinilyticus TaxID=1391 RepID=UPI003523A201